MLIKLKRSRQPGPVARMIGWVMPTEYWSDSLKESKYLQDLEADGVNKKRILGDRVGECELDLCGW